MPPWPRDGLFGVTFHAPLQADPLGFMTRVAREHGDFAFVRVGWVRLYFVNRPELIREVLTTKIKSFRKLGRQMKALRKIEGEGLVVSHGRTWARHRPVVQGSFHARHMKEYARLVVERAEDSSLGGRPTNRSTLPRRSTKPRWKSSPGSSSASICRIR